MLKNGQWNDEECSDQLPFVCRKVARTEFCDNARDTGEVVRCGEPGTNEQECFIFGCCYDPMLSQ